MKYLIIIVFAFLTFVLQAQEFNCKVTVTHRAIQGTNTSVFETMETAINEFMNNRKWTNDAFSPNERIECNILLNLTDMKNNEQFSGTLTIQARRPVHNSAYKSLILNYIDKNFSFRYVEFDPLVFNENTFENNLTSILAYYSYLILGLDYDSFAPMGGQAFYQSAELIVNNAQNASEAGWKPMENRTNRYWIIEQLLHDDFKPLRMFYYNYHINGLDVMADNPMQGINAIKEAVPSLEISFDKQPSAVLLQIFNDTKYEEFVKLFEPHNAAMRNEVGTILKKIDPQHIKEYDKLISG